MLGVITLVGASFILGRYWDSIDFEGLEDELHEAELDESEIDEVMSEIAEKKNKL